MPYDPMCPHHGTSDMPWLPATAAKIVITLNSRSAQWSHCINERRLFDIGCEPWCLWTRATSGSPINTTMVKISHSRTMACIHQNSMRRKRSQSSSRSTR